MHDIFFSSHTNFVYFVGDLEEHCLDNQQIPYYCVPKVERKGRPKKYKLHSVQTFANLTHLP